MNSNCYICNTQLPVFQWEPRLIIDCPVCGKYQPSEYLLQKLYERPLINSYLYSGAIRENYEKGVTPWVENLNELLDSVSIPQSPLEQINRLLVHIAKTTDSAEKEFTLRDTDYSLVYAKSAKEYTYLFGMAVKLNYLEQNYSGRDYHIAVNGWKHLSELPKKELRTNQAFVAMWFNPELNDAWENGLKLALQQTGYDPMRIDLAEHNEKIDDRIIAEIRKSGLLIADFTGQRGGVYFEAGFALGLGIPVIWTCRNTDIEQLHFDTRQYNHIVWQNTDDLKLKLINRIEATLPNRLKLK